jgi:hypothetical protein
MFCFMGKGFESSLSDLEKASKKEKVVVWAGKLKERKSMRPQVG